MRLSNLFGSRVSRTRSHARRLNVEHLEIRVLLSGDPAVSVDLDAPYIYRFGVTGAQLNEDFFNEDNPDSWVSRGYMPDMIREYHNGSQVLFSTRWSQGVGARVSYFGMSLQELNQRRAELEPDWQLFDIDAHTRPSGQVQFAAVWAPNPDGDDFELHTDQSGAQLDALIDILEPQNLWPTRVAAYEDDGQTRYVSLWKPAEGQWLMYFGQTRDEYQTLINDTDGFRVIHVDQTTNPADNQRFSVIFHADPSADQRVQTNRDWYLHQRNFNNNLADGYVIENIVATDIPEGADPANPRSRFGMISEFVAEPEVTVNSSLASRIRYHVNQAPARVGASILELTTGEQTSVHAGAPYSAASAIKAMILAELARRVDADPAVTLDTTIAVGTQSGSNGPPGGTTAVDGNTAVPGNATALDTTAPGNDYSLRSLAQLMINVSHNLAANELTFFLGMQNINDTMDALGMETSQLNRFMNNMNAFAAGNDNFLVPSETVEFYRRLHENEGNFLTNSSYTFFWNTLTLDGGPPNNTKGAFDNFLSTNAAIPGWQSLIAVDSNGVIVDNNKPGSLSPGFSTDSMGNVTITGSVGDYVHKPQMGAHRIATDAGRIGFTNGNTIAFAVFADGGDVTNGIDPNGPAINNAIACIGYEVAFEYADAPVTHTPQACALSDGRVLRINGRSASDEIVVRQAPSNPANIEVFVAIDLTPGLGNYDVSFGAPLFTVAAANVDSIIVDGAGGGDYIDVLSLPMPIPLRVEGGGDDDLIRVNVPAIVQGGAGADEIIVGRGDLDSIGGTVSVNGQSGQDSLKIDDSANSTSETYTINSAAVTRTGSPLFTFSYSEIESLELLGGIAADHFNIDGTPIGLSLYVDGGGASDRFEVGFHDFDSNIRGDIEIEGGGNGLLGDELIIEDTLDDDDDSYIFSGTLFTKDTGRNLHHTGIEHVRLDANPDDNEFSIISTISDLTITTGGGENTIFAGGNDIAGNFAQAINGDLRIVGDLDSEPDTLILSDVDDLGADEYVFERSTVDPGGTFDKTGYDHLASYLLLDSVVLYANSGDNTVLLNGAGVGAAVTLNTRNGDDEIHVGAVDNGDLDSFTEVVTIDGGGGGDDDLNLHDEADSGDDWYGLDENNVMKSAFALDYSNVESLTLYANPFDNEISVHRTGPTTPVTVQANNGADRILITPAIQNLNVLLSDVTVNGRGGGDTLVVDDSNQSNVLIAEDPYTITASTLSRPNVGVVSYATVERLELRASNLDSTIDVISTHPMTPVDVYGNRGEDLFNVNVPTLSAVTLVGGDDTDLADMTATAGDDEVHISAGLGSAHVNVIDVENGAFRGGGGTDVLVFAGIAGADEQVEVHGSTSAHQGLMRIIDAIDLLFEHTELIDLLANPGDMDTAAFIGTDDDNQFEINLGADGTNTDPVAQLFQPDGIAPLLSLRDYRNFGILGIEGRDGADVFNVHVAATGPGTDHRDLLIDGGLPSGPGNNGDQLTVYWQGLTPPPPDPPPTNTGSPVDHQQALDRFFVDYDPLHRFTIDYLNIELAQDKNANAAG